jgi:tyrosinase
MEYGGGTEYGEGGGPGEGGGEYGPGPGEGGGGQLLTRYDIWDLNNGAVSAFPVKNPPGWDDVSLYYAKALQKMGYKQNPAPGANVESMWTYSETPNSYYFQAAMHWTPKWPNSIPPAPYNAWWNHCTHGPASSERFFLPWHRIFIYWYEVIIRSYVQTLGGPAGWALPYWNYSYFDTSDPNGPWPRARLPWVFCQPKLPDNTGNPLYIADTAKRGFQPTWPGTPNTMYLEDTTPYYNQAYNATQYDNTNLPGFNPTLDGQPHGAVHVDVGSGDLQISPTGWMQSTVTAGFDPIFWLHHSEIDRFWVGWNANGGPNPTDSGWLTASSDPFRATRWNFWQDGTIGNVINQYPQQFLDPANLPSPCPYSYQYANLPQTPAPTPPANVVQPVPQSLAQSLAAAGSGPADAELASADQPVELGKEPVTAELALAPEAAPVMESLAGAPEEAPRVVLDLENVVADGPPGNYEVYLNYPDADQETKGSVPHYVGLLAGFGADHSHGEGHEHGVSAKYDITDIVNHLREAGDWDESKVTLTFVPAARAKAEELVISGVRVGKVSISST